VSETHISRKAAALSWVLQLVVAVILGQTLFFKFTGAPEARELFTNLGVEPWGRIGTGVIELVIVVLVLVPRRAVYGALLAIAVMAGAIASHLAVLGIEVAGDGGALFAMAWIALLAAAGIVWIRRADLPFPIERAPGVAGR